MSDKQTSDMQAENEPIDQEQALRKRLLRRIAVAFVLILGLLGGLAVFDSLTAVSPPGKTQTAKTEAPPPPQPLSQSLPEQSAVKEEEVVPDTTEAPNADALKGAPARERPLTAPATPRQAMVKPGENAAAPAAVLPRKEVGREVARVVPEAAVAHAPASRPLSQGREINRNFVIQMGVFSNPANAEELRAKLEMNGIPARVEARVQVGPFKSRQEAEAAQKKLTALGIDTGMLVSSKR